MEINKIDNDNSEMLCSAIQMCSTNNKLLNLITIKTLIEKAIRATEGKLTFVCLPECCAFMGHNSQETILASEPIDANTNYPTHKSIFNLDKLDSYINEYDGISYMGFIPAMCELAKNKSIWISVGGFPEKRDDKLSNDMSDIMSNKMSNTHVLIDPSGKISAPLYRKIHLFDSPLAGLLESNSTVAGNTPVTAKIGLWNAALTICYDLRFPSLYQSMRYPKPKPNLNSDPILKLDPNLDSITNHSSKILDTRLEPTDIILVPSAFTRRTGVAHWEILLRARAIETQSYVIAAAQAGVHNEKRSSFGHSIIIDPWGNIVSSLAEEKEGFCLATLNRSFLKEVRDGIPLQDHLRPDIYCKL